MSYLENVKNFSHCPLKKRPLHFLLHDEGNYDFDEPQDLRVKRKKSELVDIEIHTEDSQVQSSGFQHVKSLNRLSCDDVMMKTPSDTEYQQDALFNNDLINGSRIPPLADFYLHLFQQSSTSQSVSQHQPAQSIWPLNLFSTPWHSKNDKYTPAGTFSSLPSPSPSETHLSSPRSVSSEDSGLGNECGSEDEGDASKELGTEVHQKFLCQSCGKSYSTHSGFRKHTELHCTSLGIRKFSCKHCGKIYNSIGALKMHIRTHTLPCKCHICGKAFSRPWLLQGHIRTHTGEKPFECQQCHRSFADRSNLRAHQQTHERIKKYACQTCKKTFSRMSLLNKHTQNACSAQKL